MVDMIHAYKGKTSRVEMFKCIFVLLVQKNS